MARDDDAVFCVTIEYSVGTPDPGRVFRSMARLITALSAIDGVLESSLGLKGSPTILLEDIQTGSLKAWLRNGLEAIDDEALADLSIKRAVGGFLVRGKRRLLESLKENPQIESREDVRRIQSVVAKVAEESGVKALPMYTAPNPERLLRAASHVSEAVAELASDDKASYVSDEGAVEIGRTFAASKEQIESVLTRESRSSTAEMILKVKKPDYLGASMWEVRHGEHNWSARIEDAEWLRRFQSRDVDVRPGDSLRAIVRTDVRYGYQNEVVSEHRTILQVLETLPLERDGQISLLPTDPNSPYDDER